MSREEWKNVLRDTAPVMTGYLVLGMGFGILMDASGFGIGLAAMMSVFIYAGSMQYAAIGLLTGGASLWTVALVTLAVNARHLFYGISMVEPYKKAGWGKPYMVFALTDETYSLVCRGDKSLRYDFLVSLFDQCYWVGGTLLGALLGNVLPFDTTGIDFALTALFLTIFTDQWIKSDDHFPALCGIFVSAASVLLFGADSFLIPAMLGITVLLLLRRKEAAV